MMADLPPAPAKGSNMASTWPIIIFMDIDGVLNNHHFLVESQSCKIDPACVQRMNRIIRETDARIVLCSAWRYMIHGHAMTLDGFHYLLRTHGFIGSINGSSQVIVDITCRDEDIPGRPDQIRAWLNNCIPPGPSYVIIDDLDEVWGDLHIVQPLFDEGLTDEQADLAIMMIRQQELAKMELCEETI
jgi:hypothetical protein